jgi:hypothetical protein
MFVYQSVNEMELHYIIYKISFEGLIVELPFLFGVPMEHEKDHPWRSVSKEPFNFSASNSMIPDEPRSLSSKVAFWFIIPSTSSAVKQGSPRQSWLL